MAITTSSPQAHSGPRPHVVSTLRSALAMARDPARFFLHLAHTYGPFVRFTLPGTNVVFLNEPAAIDQVLHSKACIQSIDTPAMRAFLGQYSLVLMQGESWFTHRRLLQNAFHRPTIARMTGEIASVASAYMSSHLGGVVEVRRVMNRLAQTILTNTMVHVDDARLIETMAQAIDTATHITTRRGRRLFPLPAWLTRAEDKRFNAAMAAINEIIQQLVVARRSSSTPPQDMLTLLALAKDADSGQEMSADELRDEMLTLFLAGQETTANALTWLLVLLTQHPDVCERVRAESERVLGSSLPSMETMGQLTYTRQVVEEALRLYSPSWMMVRKATADVETPLGHIAAGTLVFMSPFVLHRQANFWSDPERFDPERFAPDAPRPMRGSYIPFGAGPRICLGEHFARAEMMAVLALLVRDWDWSAVTPIAHVPWVAEMTIQPKQPVVMRFTRRSEVNK